VKITDPANVLHPTVVKATLIVDETITTF